jgi:uncharacterized protein
MTAWPASDHLEAGRVLFNAGRYFEAHEVWEEAWLSANGEPRRLLQGLIQLAAAFHKASTGGSARGCVHLIDEGLAKLEGIEDGGSTLALGRLRRDLRAFRARAEAWKRGEAAAPERPFPRLHPIRSRAAAGQARTRPSRRASTRKTSPAES